MTAKGWLFFLGISATLGCLFAVLVINSAGAIVTSQSGWGWLLVIAAGECVFLSCLSRPLPRHQGIAPAVATGIALPSVVAALTTHLWDGTFDRCLGAAQYATFGTPLAPVLGGCGAVLLGAVIRENS